MKYVCIVCGWEYDVSAGRTAFPRFPESPMSARTGMRRGSAPRRNIG